MKNKSNEPEEKVFTEKAIQKQYELAINVHQNETGRFWTRMNIFFGIQFVGIIGILSNLKILLANPDIFRYLMIFCCVLSSLVVIIAVRGISSANMLLKMIEDIENQSKELIPMVGRIREHNKLPQFVNFIVAAVITFLFSILWWSTLIYLESKCYSLFIQ